MEIKNFNAKIQSEDSGLFQALRELTGRQVAALIENAPEWQPWPAPEVAAVRT